jgi:hypothetical protein
MLINSESYYGYIRTATQNIKTHRGKDRQFFLLMAVVHIVTTLLEGVELLKVLKCIGTHETQTRHLNITINHKYIFIHATRLHQ